MVLFSFTLPVPFSFLAYIFIHFTNIIKQPLYLYSGLDDPGPGQSQISKYKIRP